jgi:murein DD-endopeptidase MepM/ murein hydrolase activator NlpD
MGLESRYAHNERLSVRVGDRVRRGQMVAAAGSTGNSSAPHVHFEIRKNGMPVDPLQYLD